MKKLSGTQVHTLEILNAGGKLFVWDDGSYGLDDVDNNTLPFRSTTFHALSRYNLIKIVERPVLGCEVYGLSEGAKNSFRD
jgi:hypothetical protein